MKNNTAIQKKVFYLRSMRKCRISTAVCIRTPQHTVYIYVIAWGRLNEVEPAVCAAVILIVNMVHVMQIERCKNVWKRCPILPPCFTMPLSVWKQIPSELFLCFPSQRISAQNRSQVLRAKLCLIRLQMGPFNSRLGAIHTHMLVKENISLPENLCTRSAPPVPRCSPVIVFSCLSPLEINICVCYMAFKLTMLTILFHTVSTSCWMGRSPHLLWLWLSAKGSHVTVSVLFC